MTGRAEIALFDLDGVLIQPGGYRHAVRSTIRHFLQQAGLGEGWIPSEEELSAFEALGISAEWDMIPLWLSLVLDELSDGDSAGWHDWPAASAAILGRRVTAPRADWTERVRRFGSRLQPGYSPSEAVLNAERAGPLFARLAGAGVLAELLADTRSIETCRTTQVFQEFVLGSQECQQLWSAVPVVGCDSALVQYDRSLLAPEIAAELNARTRSGQFRAAAFTARPSRSPDPGSRVKTGYTPEAELAASLIDLDQLPVVGHGTVQYAAEKAGLAVEQLLKPAPFQALLGFAAAFGQETRLALPWAYAVASTGRQNGRAFPEVEFSSPTEEVVPGHFKVNVFEDSPNGLRSALEAAQLLAQFSIQVSVRCWGIARNPDKTTALEALGAVVHGDVNQAVRSAWPEWFSG